MSAQIERQFSIIEDKLDKSNYLQSLLNEAIRLKLLSSKEVENIRMQLSQLFAYQANKYTQGDSCSMAVDKAQSLMLSIIYSIDYYLKSLSDTDASLIDIKTKEFNVLHMNGKELIRLEFEKAKKLFNLVQENKIITQNYAYNDTIGEGLPSFFKDYEIEFSSYETMASIDYPLCIDKMDTSGIEYISSYLEKLYWENEFCLKFHPNDISSLLCGYSYDNKEQLVNIFELVLSNSIGSILLKRSARDIIINYNDCEYLQLYLSGLKKNELEAVISKSVGKMTKELNIDNEFLGEYIYKAVDVITLRIIKLLEINRMSEVFIVCKEEQEDLRIHFEDGKMMDDELFRRVTHKIRECNNVSDKIEIVLNQVHSLADLADVFSADCFFDNEYFEVFSAFEDSQISILLSRVKTNKAFYSDGFSNYDEIHLSEGEKEWQNNLIIYIESIDEYRKEKIVKMAEKLIESN